MTSGVKFKSLHPIMISWNEEKPTTSLKAIRLLGVGANRKVVRK